MTGEDAIARYAARLAERSQDSASNAVIYARVFLRLAGVAEMRDVTRNHLEQYRAWLASRTQRASQQPLALSSQAVYAQAVRLFLLFCEANGWLSLTREEVLAVLVLKPARTERPYDVLSDDEMQRILAGADQRQRALLTLALYAGLRISEILQVRAGEVIDDQARGLCLLHVARGKGNKSRDVPLARDVCDLLQGYAAARPPEQRLFTLSRSRARVVMCDAIRSAGITRRITPHALRHTYAFRLARAGTPLVAIRLMLGHSSLEVTQRYVDHLTAAQVAQYAPGLVGVSNGGI